MKCTAHFEFIPQGQTVNQSCQMEGILKRLREAVRRNRSELRPSDWIFRHDNAPGHKALAVKQIMDQKFVTEKEHPPHSPYLVPNAFSLFPKIKYFLKGDDFVILKTSKRM